MKKTVIVMGTGAQGGTIAMRLNEEPNVEKIICADYDLEAARRYEKMLDKAVAVKVDARNTDDIVAASKGAALIVNGLPPDFNLAAHPILNKPANIPTTREMRTNGITKNIFLFMINL